MFSWYTNAATQVTDQLTQEINKKAAVMIDNILNTLLNFFIWKTKKTLDQMHLTHWI